MNFRCCDENLYNILTICVFSGYKVEKLNPKTGKWEKASGTLPPDTKEFKVPKLKEGEEYKFRVKAENDLGAGEPLESEEAVTPKNPFGKRLCFFEMIRP